MDGSKHLAFAICQLSLSSPKNLTVVVREEFFMFVIDYHCLLRINIKKSYRSVSEKLLVVLSPFFSLLGKFKNGPIKILLHLLADIVICEVINNNNNGFR